MGPCPTEDVLLGYVEHTLDEAERARADEHLAGCAACRGVIAAAAGGLLETTAGTAAVGGGPAEGLAPGTKVERYLLGAQLGAGESGVVFAARDPELQRDVAIKLVRPRWVNAEDRGRQQARLRHEGQAMARLRHPNVVAVFDVGEWQDRVFIAMELVAGQTLRAWLSRPARTWREVLAVFVGAGAGLAAAHAAGIVHRDFKPANVLVGDDGRVCVTDFGLAAGGWEADSPRAAPAGTPRYMAPEQFQAGRLDARTDVFAFSVALFEALHGEPPFAGDSVRALARAVSAGEVREPQGGARVPGWLRRAVARGLRPRPDDRYPSMGAFLAVLTRDRGRRLRAGLLVAGLAAAAVAAIGLSHRAAGPPPCSDAAERLAGVWDPARKAAVRSALGATGRAYAAATWERLAARLDGWTADWTSMRQDACLATAVRHEQSEALLDLRMACLDRRRDELRALVDVLAVADPAVVERAVAAASQLEPLATCADRAALEEVTPLPADAAARARVSALTERLDDAVALTRAGKYAEAGKRLPEIVSEARALGHRPLLAAALFHSGVNQAIVARGGAGVDAPVREAAQLAASAHDGRLEAKAWLTLAQATDEQGHAETAEAFRAAAEAAVARAGDPPDLRRRLLAISGRALRHAGKLDEARRMIEQSVALEQITEDDYFKGTSVNDLALVLRDQGKLAEAAAQLDRARALFDRALGPEHPFIAGVLLNIGNVHTDMGDYPAARAAYQASLAVTEKTLGADHVDVAATLTNLAAVACLQRRYADAEALGRRALAMKERILGPDHPSLQGTLEVTAAALVGLGRVAEARPIAARLLALAEREQTPPRRVARALTLMATIDRLEDRVASAARAVDRVEVVLAAAHLPDERQILVPMAEVRLAEHRPADASKLAERAAAVLDLDPVDRAELDALRARARREQR